MVNYAGYGAGGFSSGTSFEFPSDTLLEASIKTYNSPRIFYTSVLPVGSFQNREELNSGANSVTSLSQTFTGQANLMANDGTGAGEVGVNVKPATHRAYTFGILLKNMYKTDENLRYSTMGRIDLSAQKQIAVAQAYHRAIENAFFLGYSETGVELTGFVDYQDDSGATPEVLTAPNGASGSATWLDKTNSEIIADITSMANKILVDSGSARTGSKLLLPTELYGELKNRPFTTSGAGSVGYSGSLLDYVRNVILEGTDAKKVVGLPYLKGVGTAGVDRAVMIDSNAFETVTTGKGVETVRNEAFAMYLSGLRSFPPVRVSAGETRLTTFSLTSPVVYDRSAIVYMDGV